MPVGCSLKEEAVWHIDPLLGNNRKTRRWPLLGNSFLNVTVLEPLMSSGLRTTIEVLLEAVSSMWSALRLYHLTNQVHLVQWSGAE
jgi:hypothetical protein